MNNLKMHIDILTLFPEMLSSPLEVSILKRAQDKGIVSIAKLNIRDFADNKHNMADDIPYGGGAGMVMLPSPIFRTVQWARKQQDGKNGKLIYLTPGGRKLTQEMVWELAKEEHLMLLCGHYEGIDQRVIDELVDEEISIGDYVLTGGELPAMVLADAVIRLIPGVLGEFSSTEEESFSDGLLEYPHYTRPRNFEGLDVPEVLFNGHHEKIRLWRRRLSLLKTLMNRPELLLEAELSDEDKYILKEITVFLERLNLPPSLEKRKKGRSKKNG